MAAVQSALQLLRKQRFIPGYNLVVSGGACAPDTKIDTENFTDIANEYADSCDLGNPHSSLSTGESYGRHLVVCGGVLTTTHTHLNLSIFAFAKCNFSNPCTLRIFQPQPSLPPCTDAICAVVPGHLQLWPRTGVG